MLKGLIHALLALAFASATPAMAVGPNGNANGAANGPQSGNAGPGDGNGANQGNGPANGPPNGNTGPQNGNPGPGGNHANGGNGNAGHNANGAAQGATLPPRLTSDQDAALAAVQQGRALPLEQILDEAKRAEPGQVLDAELVRVNGFLLYELKILSPDGQTVTQRYFYARSGKPVEPH